MIKNCSLIVGILLASSLGTAAYADNTPQEAANKKLVLDFYAALAGPNLKDRMEAIAERYVAPGYIQHLDDTKNGREALVQYLTGPRTGTPREKMPPAKLIAIMAEGDKVIQVTSRDMPDPATGGTKPAIIWNMFRIENGQLAEHWDALPPSIRPPSASK
jgi:predicted SnoaL-like aldol condensation-catalyzing enzyme